MLQLEFELAYNDVAFTHVSHFTIAPPPLTEKMTLIVLSAHRMIITFKITHKLISRRYITISINNSPRLRTSNVSRSKWFPPPKKKKEISTETVTDAVYADDLVLLDTTLVQVKSLLHSLEQPAEGIGLYLISDKI